MIVGVVLILAVLAGGRGVYGQIEVWLEAFFKPQTPKEPTESKEKEQDLA